MELPFTLEDFFNVFKSYNQSIFPLQILFNIIAFFCVYLLFNKLKYSNKIIASILSFFWFWMGIVYHLMSFASINNAAYFFAALFIVQGILFSLFGVFKPCISFKYQKNASNKIGIALIFYALFLYPIIGYLFNHQYPYSPTFGLPCPTTIFTFGVLLFVNKKIPLLILFIPFLWSFIGFSAALYLSVYEDSILLFAGIISIVLVYFSNNKYSKNIKTL